MRIFLSTAMAFTLALTLTVTIVMIMVVAILGFHLTSERAVEMSPKLVITPFKKSWEELSYLKDDYRKPITEKKNIFEEFNSHKNFLPKPAASQDSLPLEEIIPAVATASSTDLNQFDESTVINKAESPTENSFGEPAPSTQAQAVEKTEPNPFGEPAPNTTGNPFGESAPSRQPLLSALPSLGGDVSPLPINLGEPPKPADPPTPPVKVVPPAQLAFTFSSAPNDWFDNFEFRAFEHPNRKSLEKVLVIFVPEIKLPEKAFGGPEWELFANQNQIGLVVIAYKYTENPLKKGETKEGRQSKANDLLAKEIKNQILSQFPSVKEYAHYGIGTAAELSMSLIAMSPEDILFWVIEDAIWHAPERPRKWPVGLVVNRNVNITLPMVDAQQINRKGGKEITFVRNLSEDRSIVVDFMSLFTVAVLERGRNSEMADLESEKLLALNASRDRIANSSWFPSSELVSKWRKIHTLTENERLWNISKETVVTGVASQPQLDLYLRIPASIKPEERPEGVVCIVTWFADERDMMKLIKEGTVRPDLVRWADTNKYAVVTWNTKQLWRPGISQSELDKADGRILDADFDKITLAWEKGIRRLVMMHGLPTDDYFIFGLSRGAQWGHRLVLRKPERFAAAHFHVANSYDVVTPKAAEVMWLITTGERDSGYHSTFEFYNRCRASNYPIIVKAGPNLGHNSSSAIESLGNAFFDYAVGIKKKCSEMANTENAVVLSSAERMREDLKNAEYFGDFINQEIHPTAESPSWVPVEQRIPLVSAAKVAEIWGGKLR
jgi:hypothetical protein